MKMKKWMVMLCLLLTAGLLAACGKKDGGNENKEIDLNALHEDIKAEYGENYGLDMPYDAAALENFFGLSEDMVEEFVAEGPMISINVNQFVAVKAKEGKADEAEAALNEFREFQVDGALQYPINIPKLEAAKVVRHGNYVFYVLLGFVPMDVEDQGEDAVTEYMSQEVQRAVDIIDGYFE